jgi:hypothetical protein
MTERTLRNLMSVFLILSHVAILGLVLALFILNGLSQTEFSTSLAIITPMLAALTGLAVSYVIGAKNKPPRNEHSPILSGIYVFATLLLPLVFVIAVAALVVMKAINYSGITFEQFKLALTGTETIFGAYTGKLLASLFEKGRTR